MKVSLKFILISTLLAYIACQPALPKANKVPFKYELAKFFSFKVPSDSGHSRIVLYSKDIADEGYFRAIQEPWEDTCCLDRYFSFGKVEILTLKNLGENELNIFEKINGVLQKRLYIVKPMPDSVTFVDFGKRIGLLQVHSTCFSGALNYNTIVDSLDGFWGLNFNDLLERESRKIRFDNDIVTINDTFTVTKSSRPHKNFIADIYLYYDYGEPFDEVVIEGK